MFARGCGVDVDVASSSVVSDWQSEWARALRISDGVTMVSGSGPAFCQAVDQCWRFWPSNLRHSKPLGCHWQVLRCANKMHGITQGGDVLVSGGTKTLGPWLDDLHEHTAPHLDLKVLEN